MVVFVCFVVGDFFVRFDALAQDHLDDALAFGGDGLAHLGVELTGEHELAVDEGHLAAGQ